MTETIKELKHYQVLINNVRDGIHVMDIHGDIVEVNDAFCEMLGYTREEASKLNIADWNSQYSKGELLARIKNFVGKNARFDTVHRRKDGTLINVEVSLKGVDLEGQTYIFASSRDITERKHAEMILLQHKAAIDTTHEGFWMTDEQGVILEANQAYAEMSGYSVDELRGMRVLQFEAKEQSLSEVKAHIEKVISQGWDVFETRHRHKDGHEIELEVSISHIPDSNQIVAFFRDITERKQAETELRIAATALKESGEQYLSLISVMAEGVTLQDENSAIITFNKSAERILGLTSDQLRGKTWLDPSWQSIHEDGSPFPGETHPVVMTLKTGLPQSDVIMGIHKPNGELTWISINVQPIFKEGMTTPYQVVATMRDITAQRRLKEEHEHLFNEVRELSRRLIQIQEQERQAIALTLHDDIGQSLTAIKVYASSIKHYCHLQDLDRVLQLANEVNHISNGLLDTVRNQLRDLRPMYLNELGLKDALKNLCETWENSGAIACNLKITGPVDELPNDIQVQLFRIVQEGLTNVARHAAASTANVELLTGSHGLKLDIADDGCGFDQSATVPGMGLIGMRERTFSIGGHFDLQSAPGAGTHIRIRLQSDPDQDNPAIKENP